MAGPEDVKTQDDAKEVEPSEAIGKPPPDFPCKFCHFQACNSCSLGVPKKTEIRFVHYFPSVVDSSTCLGNLNFLESPSILQRHCNQRFADPATVCIIHFPCQRWNSRTTRQRTAKRWPEMLGLLG